VDAVLGVKRDGGTELQSIRFSSAKWSASQAREWLKTNGYSAAGFERATGATTGKAVGGASGSPVAAPVRFDVDGLAAAPDGKQVKLRFTVYKVDKWEQKLFGWLYISRGIDGVQVVDHSGEVVSIKTLEPASYRYVHEHRKMGDMHRRTCAACGVELPLAAKRCSCGATTGNAKVVQCGHLIECVVYTPEKRAAMAESLGLPRDTFEKLLPDGMWVGYQITDPQTWADVLSGKKRALSLGGRAQRVPLTTGAQ
jgi:hypothetical protein